MKNLDIAVIGSGIGGSLISALNSEKDLILFEKAHNLGGCASTFKRYGNFYNTGATTFVGYEEGHIVKNIFTKINIKPNLTKSDIAIRIIQNNKTVDRIQDFEAFLEMVNQNYFHKNNRIFWEKLREIDRKFWQLKKIYFGKFGVVHYSKTALFIAELLQTFQFDLFKSASCYIDEVLFNCTIEYKKFIDAQLLITVQTTSKDISLLSLALGLSYPFHDVFYVNGGMGSLISDILKDVEVKKNEEIYKIFKEKKSWRILSSKGEYLANRVVLNSTIYDSKKLFEDAKIKQYFESFHFSDTSAFVVYLTLEGNFELLHHYQIILNQDIPNCISNAFFISLSDNKDEKMSKNGLSVTISTHTKASFWKDLQKDEYEKKKKETEFFIINKFLEYFDTIKIQNLKVSFSATSTTFNHFINRLNCGGKAIGLKNVTQLPSQNTPFKGLYNVGDTVFSGQGWPGVSLGVDLLHKELNKWI